MSEHKNDGEQITKYKIIKSQKKKKDILRKRRKRHPDDFDYKIRSKWEKLRDTGMLSESGGDFLPLKVYKKTSYWKDFSVYLRAQGKVPRINIKGHDELRHTNYMWKVVKKAGMKWFYRYAPVRQILQGTMKRSSPIVVGFDLTKKGHLENFRFIKHGTNEVQKKAVKSTFKKMRFDPPPKGFKYRNLRVRFTITKPRNLKGRGKIVWGKVYLSGQVKNLHEQ